MKKFELIEIKLITSLLVVYYYSLVHKFCESKNDSTVVHSHFMLQKFIKTKQKTKNLLNLDSVECGDPRACAYHRHRHWHHVDQQHPS